MWGIASNEAHDTVVSFGDALGLTFPILEDSDGAVIEAYAQQTAFGDAIYPQDWIIGSDGTVVYVNNGYEPDEWAVVLEKELGG